MVVGVNVCRLFVGLTFLFSGFVKCADPQGMAYKLNAYLHHWGVMVTDDSVFLSTPSILLGAAEFLLGVFLLLGIRRQTTTLVILLLMTAMTGLTTYIYIVNPVSDCGCFGDAVKLTNEETLLKNIVLLAASILLFRKRRLIWRLISERNQWVVSIFSLVYIVSLGFYSNHQLPVLDFTAYRKGTDVRSILEGKGITDRNQDIINFFLQDEDGNDRTFEVAADTGFTFLLTLPDVLSADDGCNDYINDLYDECEDKGIPFYAVVGATEAETKTWEDRTGAAYPLLKGDARQMRAAVRSNPGLLLLHDGKIAGKWSNNNLPASVDFAYLCKSDETHPFLRLLLWFVLPLCLTIFADSVWVGSKYYKRYNLRRKLNFKDMRKKIVAGNWKMNKNLQEGVALAKELNAALVADKPNCDVVICTPFIHLASVAAELDATVVGLGAENCADKASGAYTGEVSAEMVKSTGAQYVILGHSERRAYYHETAEILKEKINLALANDLKVIFCIGEVLEERESGKQNEVVKAQLEGSLFDLTTEEFKNIILAYEPVWAIGTGKTATAEQAEEMHAFIRGVIADKFGAEAAEEVSILYGGSCKPSNAKEIFAKANVDGGLIGGAALSVADFKGIIDAWK